MKLPKINNLSISDAIRKDMNDALNENMYERRINSGSWIHESTQTTDAPWRRVSDGIYPSVGAPALPHHNTYTAPIPLTHTTSVQVVQHVHPLDIEYKNISVSAALFEVLIKLDSAEGGLPAFRGVFDFRKCFSGLTLTEDMAFDMFINWWNTNKTELMEKFDVSG